MPGRDAHLVGVGALGRAVQARPAQRHLALRAAQGLLEGDEQVGLDVPAGMGKVLLRLAFPGAPPRAEEKAALPAAEERFEEIAEAGAAEFEVGLAPAVRGRDRAAAGAVEDFADPLEEGFRGVGLEQEILHAGAGGLGDGIPGVDAAGRDDPDGGLMRRSTWMVAAPSMMGIIMSVSTTAISCLLGVERDRLGAVAGGDHAVAEGLERLLGDVADRKLVVDHQHEFVPAARQVGREPARDLGGPEGAGSAGR
jgi:hypothetical protein